MSTDVDTCALCPKLCRHVCPVAVATGREAATPSAIFAEVLVADLHPGEPHVAEQALGLCTRCGACSNFCGVDQPVPRMLEEARARHQPPLSPWSPPPVRGHATTVAVVCGDRDWSGPLADALNQDLALLLTHDHLGEMHRTRHDTHQQTIEQIALLLQGRTAISSCGTCVEALNEADVTVESIESSANHHPALPRWRTCMCEPGRGVSTGVTCCGARGPLSTEHPLLSVAMADELVQRLDGQRVFVADTRCASHLRQRGASVVSPTDPLFSRGH